MASVNQVISCVNVDYAMNSVDTKEEILQERGVTPDSKTHLQKEIQQHKKIPPLAKITEQPQRHSVRQGACYKSIQWNQP